MKSYLRTFTGKKFFPFDPKPDQIDIRDIAHALSHMCRFGGHVKRFYSVAEHSVHVSTIILVQTKDPNLALLGLLHDAAEAYLVDIPHPIKIHLPDYQKLEASVTEVINKKYGLDLLPYDLIKEADIILLVTEMRDLMGNSREDISTYPNVKPMTKKIVPWHSMVAKHHFSMQYKTLTGLINKVRVTKIVNGKRVTS